MTPSSRTPEGAPHRCSVCGKNATIDDSSPIRDATCPFCGSLIWLEPTDRVRNVRGRILELVKETLSQSIASESMKEVAGGILSRITVAVGARSAAIWSLSDSGQPILFCATVSAKSEVSLFENPFHSELLKHIFQSPEECVAIGPGESLTNGITNTGHDLLIFCRFTSPRMPLGIVELLQRADTPIQARPGFQQFLQQMTGYLAGSRAFTVEPR